MRVVAMSLQMEIIVFIQEDHPSDGSSFPSTSTDLQSKSSWCPSLNSQGLRVRMSHIWPITHLFSHRERVRAQGSMGILSVPWPLLALHLSKEGNSTHWGTQLSLSWWISDNMWSTSGSSAFSVTASHEYTGQNLFWREKMSLQTPKQNITWTMKSRDD